MIPFHEALVFCNIAESARLRSRLTSGTGDAYIVSTTRKGRIKRIKTFPMPPIIPVSVPSLTNPLALYRALIATKQIEPDPSQVRFAVVTRFQNLFGLISNIFFSPNWIHF